MPTYATRADCLAYTEGLVVTDNAAFDRLIERAERDVDRVLRVDHRDGRTGGVKVPDVGELDGRKGEGLTRATCAQVEYRVALGEEALRTRQPKRVSGPEFTVEHATEQDARSAPKMLEELQRVGLLRATVAAA